MTVGDDLAARYLAVRRATEALAAPLSPEDQVLQSMPSASPTKWHRAHTTWFFEAFILEPRGRPPVREEYKFLFNSYYEAMGPRHARPKRGLLSRPTCDEVAAYRRTVDGRMLELLSSADDAALAALEPLVAGGRAPEEQHQELLLTDILHAFSESPLRPAYAPAAEISVGATLAPLGFVDEPGGLVAVGHDGHGFAFDNEGPRHRVFLEPFALATRPVAFGEVRAFIEEGGYETPSLWLSAGYERVRAEGRSAPHGLVHERGALRAFTLEGTIEPAAADPATHLDLYEADAIARFLGGRLPTEFEWEWSARAASPLEGQLRDADCGALRPRAGRGGDGLDQLFGGVWEWTSSAYGPYPGFRAAPGALGEYNGKFMVSQLVLRGGSVLTPRGHVRASYRNFWPPETQFQMTGVRVARDLK